MSEAAAPAPAAALQGAPEPPPPHPPRAAPARPARQKPAQRSQRPRQPFLADHHGQHRPALVGGNPVRPPGR